MSALTRAIVYPAFVVDLPRNAAAVLYGVVTADWLQRVVVLDGKNTYTFDGAGRGILTVNNDKSKTTVSIASVPDADRRLIITFKFQKPGQANFQDSAVQYKETGVDKYSKFFTFFTEDGGDSDHHDTDFCVSILPTTK